MQYSDEFKQKALSVLGDSEMTRTLLGSSPEIFGKYLECTKDFKISPEEIVEACEQGSYQGIYQKAKKQLAIEALFKEWLEIYHNQNRKHL